MRGGGSRPWAVVLSVLLHIGLIAVLWWGARQAMPLPVKEETPPLAIELIAGGVTPPEPQPVQPAPQPVVETPPEPPAEVNLGKKLEVPEPKPKEPAKPKPEKKLEPKPKVVEEKPKPKEQPKPEPVKKKQQVDNPTKPKQKPSSEADDLLADLGPPGPRAGKAKLSQAGAKQGVEGGSSKGSGLFNGYQTRVKARIKPFVQIPDGMSGNPTAVLRIHANGALEISSVSLEKSSGNTAYDNAVLAAVKQAGTLPPLLPAMTIDDVRDMTLKFRPKE